MLGIRELNARLARMDVGVEIGSHGDGSYFIVDVDRCGQGHGYADGQWVINSGMSLWWVNEWAARVFRDHFRIFVKNYRPFYRADQAIHSY